MPFQRLLFVALALLLPLGAAAEADVLTTTDGLVIEGDVERLETGWYRITTESGTLDLAPANVRSVSDGEGPSARFARGLAALDEKDVRGLFALALEAESAGAADLAGVAYARVLALEPDHAATRRALGYEKLDGAWVTQAEARRKQGLVLYCGRWMLPAEVEAATAKEPVVDLGKADDATRVEKLVARLADADPVMVDAARVALARTHDDLVVVGAKRALFHKDPAVRMAACSVLGELGDESALRALIFSGARDMDPEVRRAAVDAAASFGHDDAAVPFVRALGSENLRLVANAAEALAQLGDQRAAGYIVKRLSSHGSSSRNFVAFLNQVSYVRDYDVEIAQASNIANPDVATILEGVVLDVKVLGASFTKTWVEPILVDALSQIAGRPLRNRAEALDWWAENKDRMPDFPKKPSRRAPRRREGKVIGAVDKG